VHKSEMCQVQTQPCRRLWSGVSWVRCSILSHGYTDWYWLYFDFERLRPPSCVLFNETVCWLLLKSSVVELLMTSDLVTMWRKAIVVWF
jgi:hypothetical protein